MRLLDTPKVVPEHAPLIERWPLLHPVTWYFLALPFQWVPGPAGINVPYIFLMLAMAALCLSPAAIIAATRALNWSWLWLVPYLVYLGILFIALQGSGQQGMATRQVLFIAGFVTVAAWLAAASNPARLIRWWGGGAILSFLLVSEWTARGLGLSWGDAFVRFYMGGDLNFIMYGFLREIFDAAAPMRESGVPASQKNMISALLFVGLLLFRAGHAGSGRDLLGLGMTFLIIAILIMLNTRTVLVALLLGFLLIWMIRFANQAQFSLGGALLRVFLVLFAGLALVALLGSEKPMVETLSARLAFDDGSTGARMSQYTWALMRIEQAFLTGSGYAELSNQPVHNIFLGAFMHAGLFAFLLVLTFYGVTAALWLGFVHRLIWDPGHWVLPLRAEWVAVLPLQPLIRMWFSGDAGHHSVVEWTAMGVFAGLLLTNAALARAQGSAVRPRPAVKPAGGFLQPQKLQ